MNTKSRKILAQLLSVAVVGSTFAVPVAGMSKPVINVNAEESEKENNESENTESFEESDDSETEQEDYQENDEEETDEEEYDSEEDDYQYEDGWKKAYADFLKEKHTENSYMRFALAYVDDNDMPELILSSGNFHAVSSVCYVYLNGSVVQLQYSGSDYGHFDYVEKENVIYSTWSTNGNGGFGQILYHITDGKLEKIVSFYASDSLETNQRVYQINDEEVTKEQYDAKIKEYQIENVSAMGKPLTIINYDDMYEITDENIDEYIGIIEEDTSITTETTTEAPTEATTESGKNVVNISFEKTVNESASTQYAILTAHDASGNTVWTYKTKDCPCGQYESITMFGQKNGVYYLAEDNNTITALEFSTGKVLWQNNDFEGSGRHCAFGEDAFYIVATSSPDFCAVSYDGKIIKTISHLDEDYSNSEYFWADSIKIIDNKYAGVHFEANDGTLYVDLETYEVLDSIETDEPTTEPTTTKEPVTTYEWYIKPSVKADDINSVGVFMTSIPYGNSAYKDYEYTYGQFVDTGYAVIKEGDFYGVIDMNGNIVVETDFVSIRGELNDHFVLIDEDDNISYFCCETGEFLQPMEPRCPWCEDYLSTTICGSYYCYDPDNDVLVYIGTMPNDETEDVISLQGQNCSNKTIKFPEGKVIPVRMVSVDGDDVTLTDSYGIMKDGEIIIDFDYDNALSYKDGITALERDGEWYYFDEDGYQLIEGFCEASYNFSAGYENYIPYLPSEDYIAFNTAWGGGYYATDGEVVVPVGEFAEVRPVFGGLAWVKEHETGLWGVIQLTGERADAQDSDDNGDSDEDGGSTGGGSSSAGNNGKASPKTGDNSGKVVALLALSAGAMVATRKHRKK